MTLYTFSPSNGTQFVNWDVASEWSPQIVPNAADADVVMPEVTSGGSPYDYFMTIPSNQSFLIDSLVISHDYLQEEGTLTVLGTLDLEPGSEIDLSGTLSVGALSNADALDIQGSGSIAIATSFLNQGEIVGSQLAMSMPTLDNAGLLDADGMLDLQTSGGAGSFQNLSAGTLTGGTYDTYINSTLYFPAAEAITSDAADIIVQSGGIIETSGGSLEATLERIASAGTLYLISGSFDLAQPLTVDGTLEMDNATLVSNTLTIGLDGKIVGSGTIAAPVVYETTSTPVGSADIAGVYPDYSGSFMLFEKPVSGTGTLVLPDFYQNYGGETYVTMPTIEFATSVSIDLAFSAGGTVVLDDPMAFTGTIANFSQGATVTQPGFPSNQYLMSDEIVVGGLSLGAMIGSAYVGNADGGTLILQEATRSISLDFAGSYDLGDFHFATGPQLFSFTPASVLITDIGPPCFARGTRIATPSGDVPVERLAIGDRVLTASGASRPVRWIGRRSYDRRQQTFDHDLLPILIREGALADGIPRRDLYLSPRHALFLDSVLVPAARLVNGRSVVQIEDLAEISYFHIELDDHDVLLAEGAPAESFIDCDSRLMFENAFEFRLLYPHGIGDNRTRCAERIEQGDKLEALRRRIASRAGLHACHVDDEAAEPGLPDGRIDVADHALVCGWAYDPARPNTPLDVAIEVDGALSGVTVANDYRLDLAQAGKGRGCCGFAYNFPMPLAATRTHCIVVRMAASHSLQANVPPLSNCPTACR